MSSETSMYHMSFMSEWSRQQRRLSIAFAITSPGKEIRRSHVPAYLLTGDYHTKDIYERLRAHRLGRRDRVRLSY